MIFVSGIFIKWQELHSFAGNLFLWLEFSSCNYSFVMWTNLVREIQSWGYWGFIRMKCITLDRNCILVIGETFFWQEIYFCDRKSNLLVGMLFIWHEYYTQCLVVDKSKLQNEPLGVVNVMYFLFTWFDNQFVW